MANQEYTARILNVIHNKNSHYILKISLIPDGRVFTAKGDVDNITLSPGQTFTFEGEWVEDKKYGRQLKILRAPIIKKWDQDIVCSVLCCSSISSFTAKIVATALGPNAAKVLDTCDASFLSSSVPGLDTAAAQDILVRWSDARAYFVTFGLLSPLGVVSRQIKQISAHFKDRVQDIITKNPWALTVIEGITFATCDNVASSLGLDLNSPLRIEGALIHVFKTKMGMGHLFLNTGQIQSALWEVIPGVTPAQLGSALISLVKSRALVLDASTRPGLKAVYDPWLHLIEHQSAELLRRRSQAARIDRNQETLEAYTLALSLAATDSQKDIKHHSLDLAFCARKVLADWSAGSSITLSDAQAQGVVNALTEPVSIITGLPGTGKSTSLKALVSILKDANISYLLVAPTGIAAKRMANVTGTLASTIHKALGATGGEHTSDREATYVGVTGQSLGPDSTNGLGEKWLCSEVPHHADVIIVDEHSMTDQHLMYRLLSCTKDTARLVFIGDAQQLPSVGPGTVLSDLIGSGVFPTVSLTEIFRQAHTSQIVIAAHAIFNSQIPVASLDLIDEFVFVKADTEGEVLDFVKSQALQLKGSSFQVMSPRHSGTVGVTNLNAVIRDTLNPPEVGKREVKIGGVPVREGDKVMVVKNFYEKDLVNGDVGTVTNIDHRDVDTNTKHVTLKVGRREEHIPYFEASRYLRLAYCTTVHKMQGQEVDTVILPLIKGFGFQLQRNLIYTAITRAKKQVVIVGHWDAFVKGINNTQSETRNTLFMDRLIKSMS